MAKPASGTSLNTGHALYTALEAVWAMLEGTGTTSADSTGNGHTLTFAGGGTAPTWSTDGAGDAIIALGTALTQPLAVGTPFTLADGVDWSIAWRFKQTTDSNNGMVIGETGTQLSFVWQAGVALNGIRFRNVADDTDADFANADATTDKNYLLVNDFSGDGKLHLYINGSEVGTGVTPSGGTDLDIDTLGNAYSSTTFALIGSFTYCYVWDGRALTSSDATALHADPYDLFQAADTISCTDQTDGRIYQRAAGTSAKTITFAGTYTGETPATIEVQIVADDDNAELQTWTTLGGATIAGGNWSGTLSVPEGGEWYNFLARSKDGGGTVLATSSQTSNKFGVGILVAELGQSNMERMRTTSSTPPASSDLTRQYQAAWEAVAGNGDIRFANQLQAASGLLVGVLNFAVGGTTIEYWTDDISGTYTAFTDALTATGGDCEFILWHQGESDAIAGTAKATYKTALDTFYATLRTETGRSTTTLKFGCALLGNINDGTATDATTDAIRQAQLEWIGETTGAFFAGSSVDMVRFDAYHWTAPYYERMGRRYAQAIAFQLGDVAFGADGPVVASASRASGSADIEITVTHDGGTAIEELDGTTDGGSLTGWEVSDDDFSTTLTISSTAFVAGKIVLTLSAAPADVDTIKVRYQYGENPTITNPVYDDTTPQSDTIGLPLQPTIGSVTASLVGGSVSVLDEGALVGGLQALSGGLG